MHITLKDSDAKVPCPVCECPLLLGEIVGHLQAQHQVKEWELTIELSSPSLVDASGQTARDWDQQFEEDVASGKIDKLYNELTEKELHQGYKDKPVADPQAVAQQLVQQWIKDERQYRAQVQEAREKGTPWAGMLAHADQLSACRRAVQVAFGLVMHPDDVDKLAQDMRTQP